ncbi:MAG TPA: hypothetical protein VMT51_00670 [Dongiaceae bacterium]|nr:hypothetical protein [Dongiaceae bacterium]
MRFYNTGIAVCAPKWRTETGLAMDKFEEFGRKLDDELERLRRFVDKELAPETEKRTATFLREVSEKLTEAAGWLDARRNARESNAAKEPTS